LIAEPGADEKPDATNVQRDLRNVVMPSVAYRQGSNNRAHDADNNSDGIPHDRPLPSCAYYSIIALEYSATEYRDLALMRHIRFCTIFAGAAMLLARCSPAVADIEFSPASPVFAKRPPSFVRRWIWFQNVGLRNHPFPIVYLSTKRFPTRVPEMLIVVSPARFSIVSRYARTLIAKPDCVDDVFVLGADGNIKIVVRDANRTRRCVLSRASACDFFAGLVPLSNMGWTSDELKPISDLTATAACDYVQSSKGERHHDTSEH
jgi:hypothetical protein